MGAARSCRCHPRDVRPEARVDGKGEHIALACNRCMRFISQWCRVCRRDFRDLGLHLAKTECGRFDKAGMWWTADRPPRAGSPPRQQASNLTLPSVSHDA